MMNRCLMMCRGQFEALDYIRDQTENDDEVNMSDKHEVAQNCGEA
jgi:hypothetical protein